MLFIDYSSLSSSFYWVHLTSLLSNQCVAGFAAFAGRFDVYYGFPNDYGLESDYANPSYSDRTTGFFAFRGMTVIYIVSRVFMALQYCLLYFYAIRKEYPASKQFLIQIGALVISAAMWIASYFFEAEDASDALKIAKYGLWYGGILIELLATIVAWLSCRVTGFRRTHLNERFATLTLLILGEGVIGYAIALQGSIPRFFVLANVQLLEELVSELPQLWQLSWSV